MARLVFDILLDEDFELKITNGDFAIGECTQQHQNLLLLSHKGSFRQSPLVGVGLSSFLMDNDLTRLKEEVQKQFELDGMVFRSLEAESFEDLEIDAFYK